MHQVIIVGGGPSGLSAAVCLGLQGIDTLLIEKHPATTTHPKTFPIL
ncbi:MAG: FAD-dependent monooxygenase [Verrucomicrobia bacterium]|nr:FAD-dependent monooxygenase [Verrucomicrobiota bacterium]